MSPIFVFLVVSLAADVKIVDVMKGGESSKDCSTPPCTYKAFRIPGLVAVGNTTLLVRNPSLFFMERRKTQSNNPEIATLTRPRL